MKWKSRFQKNTKKESAPRQALKEATKKAKRLKVHADEIHGVQGETHGLVDMQLDPANHKTLVDLQQEAAEAQAAASSKSTSSKGKQKAAEAIDSEDDNASDASDEPPSIHMDEDPPAFKPMPKRESVAHLRAKLHTRIEELRKGRKAAPYQEWSPKEHLLEEQRQAREEAHWNSRKESPVKRKEKPPLVSTLPYCCDERLAETSEGTTTPRRSSCLPIWPQHRIQSRQNLRTFLRLRPILRIRLIIETKQTLYLFRPESRTEATLLAK